MKKKVPLLFIAATLICILIYVCFFIERRHSGNIIYLPDAVVKVETYRGEIDSKININTATIEDLMMLPNMTRPIAKSIVAYRDKYGDFILISELKDIKGISEEIYNSVKDYVTVEDST